MKEKSFFSHFMVIGAGAAINMLIGLLTTPLITRLVIPEEYGRLSMFNTYANIVMMLLGLGLDQSLVRFFYKSEKLDYKRKLLFRCWFYPVVFIAILMLPIIVWYGSSKGIQNEAFKTLCMFFAYTVILLMQRFSLLILRLNKKSKMYTAMNISQKVTYVVVALGLMRILDSYTFYMLAVATVLSHLIPTIISIVLEKVTWNPKVTTNELIEECGYSELIRYGFPLMIANGIYMIFQAIDKISLQLFCTYNEVGIYASAMSLMSIIAILRTSFNTVWAPASVEQYEKDPDDRSFYQKGNQYITVIMFVVGLSMILCKDVFVLLLGEKYRDASMIMPFLLFQPIMYTISETTVVGIYFKKKSYAQLIICSAACIFNLIGNMILIPQIGPKGAAISTGCSYILFFTLRTVFSNKYYYIDFKLKKFYFITLLLVLFALYNTFISFNFITVVLYAVTIAILLLTYKNIVKDMVNTVLNKIKGKRRG